jgi:hypothetical protein
MTIRAKEDRTGVEKGVKVSAQGCSLGAAGSSGHGREAWSSVLASGVRREKKRRSWAVAPTCGAHWA